MRVVVNENMKVFHGHKPIRLTAGQEVSGELAALLLRSAPGKATAVSAASTAAEVTDDAGAPASLGEADTAAEVLAWVGEDPGRAGEAMAAEEARDKPRSTLIKQLAKLNGG